MNDPARWRSPDGDAPSEARELLRHAAGPRAFDAAARARNAATIAKISAGAVSAPTTTLFGAKLAAKVALAALVAISASVTVQRVRAHREPHHAAVVARSASPTVPAPIAERAARVEGPSVESARVAVVETAAERPSSIVAPVVAAPAAPVVAPALVAAAPPPSEHHHVAVVAAHREIPVVAPTSRGERLVERVRVAACRPHDGRACRRARARERAHRRRDSIAQQRPPGGARRARPPREGVPQRADGRRTGVPRGAIAA